MNYFNRLTKNKNITLENLDLDSLSKDEIDFIQTLDFNEYFNKLEEHLEETYDNFDMVELIERMGLYIFQVLIWMEAKIFHQLIQTYLII